MALPPLLTAIFLQGAALAQAPEPSPVGFFYFKEHGRLDPARVAAAPARLAITWEEFEPALAKRARKQRSKEIVDRAARLYESPLYKWADAVNFHYYEHAEALPEVVAFLRRGMPAGKPLMSNEIGFKRRFAAGPGCRAYDRRGRPAPETRAAGEPLFTVCPAGR